MRVDSIKTSINYTSMHIGASIKKRLADKRCSRFPQRLKEIKDVVKQNGFDKKENVDIILQYEGKNRFYAVISSKKQGVPMHPDYRCDISTESKSIEKFANWINEWNESYDPKWMDF